jgi:hypothetical protein
MLDLAAKYEPELQKLFANITFDEHYKFLYNASYREKYKASESTWNMHEFVSLKEGKVIGYLKYDIDRDSNKAYGMMAVNFASKGNYFFAEDMMQFLKDIFEKFHFRKLRFCCIIGNPIEKMYDEYIFKFGGRIVGIEKEESRLIDGHYYDLKLYEILYSEYKKVTQ